MVRYDVLFRSGITGQRVITYWTIFAAERDKSHGKGREAQRKRGSMGGIDG